MAKFKLGDRVTHDFCLGGELPKLGTVVSMQYQYIGTAMEKIVYGVRLDEKFCSESLWFLRETHVESHG